MDRIYNKLVNGINNDGSNNAPEASAEPMLDTMDCTTAVVASDKVALIISNRTYAPNMSNLITPHCDAETLAEILQQMKFKTVTLGDLKLEEMRFIIKEYRKLLGEGVYGEPLELIEKQLSNWDLLQRYFILSGMDLKPMDSVISSPPMPRVTLMDRNIAFPWTGCSQFSVITIQL